MTWGWDLKNPGWAILEAELNRLRANAASDLQGPAASWETPWTMDCPLALPCPIMICLVWEGSCLGPQADVNGWQRFLSHTIACLVSPSLASGGVALVRSCVGIRWYFAYFLRSVFFFG